MQKPQNKNNRTANSTRLLQELPAIHAFFLQVQEMLSTLKKCIPSISTQDRQKIGNFSDKLHTLSKFINSIREFKQSQLSPLYSLIKDMQERNSKLQKDLCYANHQIKDMNEKKSKFQQELCYANQQIDSMQSNFPEKALIKELWDAKKQIRDNQQSYQQKIDTLKFQSNRQMQKCQQRHRQKIGSLKQQHNRQKEALKNKNCQKHPSNLIKNKKAKLTLQSHTVKISGIFETPFKRKLSISVPKKRSNHFSIQMPQENGQID